MSLPSPQCVSDLFLALSPPVQWDAVVVLGPDDVKTEHAGINQIIEQARQIDQRVGKQTLLLHAPELPGNRLVYAPVTAVDGDYDDVRSYADVAANAAQVARDAGSRRPLFVITSHPQHSQHKEAVAVSYFAMTHGLWQPLEARESLDEETIEPVQVIGLYAKQHNHSEKWLRAVAEGLRVARDLCGTEPERMAPPHFADYCFHALADSAIDLQLIDDIEQLQRDYPLLMAVARASLKVERHHPRVLRAEYVGQGPITRTILLAGKGIVYDTGGADLKIGGHMAGMSRDKGGAAAVAGFLKTVAMLAPRGLRVIAEIGAVRNSIGSDAFVPDEIIRSHAGVRVRIGNTDAEGRLVLADLLSHLRSDATAAVNPTLYSIATLTGHAARSVGPYTALVENAPALEQGLSAELARLGDVWGDPSEVSRSRREDWQFIAPRSQADDVLSCNNAASAVTPRGHQFPMAFMAIASGIDKHGRCAEIPLPYCHIDIAGSGISGGDWQHGKPTGASVVMLAARYLLD